MGAPKGHPKYGGRKKGTPNKTALPLYQKAQELGVDPFVILLLFAKGDWKGLGYESATKMRSGKNGEVIYEDIIGPDHRLKAAAEACQYLHSKRKAIEVKEVEKDPAEDPLEHLSDEELDDL